MNLDIRAAVAMIVLLLALTAVGSILTGIRRIRRGRGTAYYRMRAVQMRSGKAAITVAALLVGLAVLVGLFAEPVAYQYFPPSPSPSRTPTISLTPTTSLTPTITLTPSITPTPAESYTPTITPTAFIPAEIALAFTSSVTPDAQAVFSPILFSTSMANYQAVDPHTVFQNPVSRIFATFSYDKMLDGVQWTALWYRDGEIIFYETEAWKGGSGGYAFSLWQPGGENWLAGTYQVVLFVGMEWKALGEFRVIGDPPTPTSTPQPSPTASVTRTPYPSSTPRPTDTRWPTQTLPGNP